MSDTSFPQCHVRGFSSVYLQLVLQQVFLVWQLPVESEQPLLIRRQLLIRVSARSTELLDRIVVLTYADINLVLLVWIHVWILLLRAYPSEVSRLESSSAQCEGCDPSRSVEDWDVWARLGSRFRQPNEDLTRSNRARRICCTQAIGPGRLLGNDGEVQRKNGGWRIEEG